MPVRSSIIAFHSEVVDYGTITDHKWNLHGRQTRQTIGTAYEQVQCIQIDDNAVKAESFKGSNQRWGMIRKVSTLEDAIL